MNFLNNKRKIINFFFPFYPLKLTKSVFMISIISILIGLRLILNFATIKIPEFGMSISIAHTPLMIVGWLFGPIIGLLVGFLTDTMCYFMNPSGLWFWLFAIQEPLLGFLSGIVASIYIIRKSRKCIIFDLVFARFVVYSFFIICLVFMYGFIDNNSHWEGISKFDSNSFINVYKYIVISCLILFILIFEIFNIFAYKRNKGREKLIIYASLICFINAILFSFILGTISAIEYYKYLHNGISSPNFIKYGYMFYLIPRIIKESIKTPIQIILLSSVLYLIIPIFKNQLKYESLTWNNDKFYKNITNVIWI